MNKDGIQTGKIETIIDAGSHISIISKIYAEKNQWKILQKHQLGESFKKMLK